ncbi:hypothetical protein G3M48_002273 [Beauveria asiatica]|uniref:GPI anchored serine-rich protein n=1 Tax=Beauveria asiatica TaxID=1069075 RepID=A0AAW0RYM8_9HYPO
MRNPVVIVSVLAFVASASIIERQDPVTVTNTVTVSSCPAAISDCAASTKYITVPCATEQSASYASGSAAPALPPAAAAAGYAHSTAASESAPHLAGAAPAPSGSEHAAAAAAGSAPPPAAGSAPPAGATPAPSGSEQAPAADSASPLAAGSAPPAGATPAPSGSEQAAAASAPAPPAAAGSPTHAGPVNGKSGIISASVGNESEGCTAQGGCGTQLPMATPKSTSTSIATVAVSRSSVAVSRSSVATPSCPPGGCDTPRVSRASTNSVSLAAGVAAIVATLSFF